MAHFGKYSDKVGRQERLVWRLRPFVGGQWKVFETTMQLLDWLTLNGEPSSSYEIQLVPMTADELSEIPMETP